jgi:hypothetical protein
MLKYFGSPIVWGVLLILGGAALLLENLLDWRLGGIFWGGAFLLGGVVFLAEYALRGKAFWWALIPGVTLLGLGAVNLLDALLPQAEAWSGALFLGAISLAFFLVYLTARENWWAIIPGGVLATLMVVSNLDETRSAPLDTGGIFFLGLGLTFLLVALLPTPAGKMTWAYIPGGILAVFGLLLSTELADLARYAIPALVILGGVVMVFRALRR